MVTELLTMTAVGVECLLALNVLFKPRSETKNNQSDVLHDILEDMRLLPFSTPFMSYSHVLKSWRHVDTVPAPQPDTVWVTGGQTGSEDRGNNLLSHNKPQGDSITSDTN